MNRTYPLPYLLLTLLLMLSGCGKKNGDVTAKAVRTLPVSVTAVRSEPVE